MSKIAILDTGISPKCLNCGSFHAYNVCGKEDGTQAMETSHGTVCAKVLDYFTSEYELFGVQIMEDSGKMTKKPMGDILHLKKGLQLCLELDVDIICLSAVSSILSDSDILYKTAEQLSSQSILLAALDNRRYMTIPTAYPFVMGIQSDMKNCLNPGELAYNPRDLFGAGLYANCNIGLLLELGYTPSNSFAVPVAAACLNQWMNQGRHIITEIRNLKPYPAYTIEEEVFLKQKSGLFRELPLAVLYAMENENTYAVCRMAIDRLYNGYDVQSSALCSKDNGSDIRFQKMESIEKLKQEILFMECCYKTDFIFLIIEKRNKNKVLAQIEADLEIILSGDRINILSEEGCVKGMAADLADLVYKILQ